MFERRLKIFLGILLAFALLLILRAAQVQVVARDYWRQKAQEAVKRVQLLETTRGRILDYRGREIAVDAASIDACVDYRAIVGDEQWLKDQARVQLKQREAFNKGTRPQREAMLAAEVKVVQGRIDALWDKLAELSSQTRADIDQVRQAVIYRVEMRRRYLWYRNYELAVQRFEQREPSPWYKQWLLDDSADAPQLDKFAIDVAEQFEPQIILRNISPEVNNYLGKHLNEYPGLALVPSTHRYYPYAEAASQLLGHMSKVNREDLQNDPNLGQDDLRQYYPNDLIGRTGLEALFEQKLRGARGRIARIAGNQQIVARVDPTSGRDVRATIDIELQKEIGELFRHATITNSDGSTDVHEMHGAAVVIDVPTGEVRALASYPTYDLNKFDELYSQLVKDEVNLPLMNRATQAQLEPGSTAKPMVGLGAITQGLIGVYQGIECTGYLQLGGRVYRKIGRCWTASMYESRFGIAGVSHHPFPIPHHGTHGNPDGFLTFSDALERSCNVFFETVGDKFGLDGLSHWFRQFGLGSPTGIGIEEASGRLPDSFNGPPSQARSTSWFAAIGQGYIAATPLQMANVAATIARNGLWVQPHLLTDEPKDEIKVRDLHLDPKALSEAQAGMVRVVNSRSGTGTFLHRGDLVIAGKTGTAQAAPFSVILRDKDGKPLRDADGKVERRHFEPNTPSNPNTEVPWYLGTGSSGHDLAHAWYIGFAPADHPQIAFAVLVEYGGSGGRAAASIAKEIIEACVRHGYLSLEGARPVDPMASR